MSAVIIQLLAGLLLLYFGAEGLVRFSAALARRLHISPLVIGLTIVAFGTSAPEMIVSLKTAISGQGALAIGNIVGSNIFNILAILGLSSIISPLNAVDFDKMDVLVMLLFSLLLLPFMWTRFKLERWEGFLFVTGYIAYLILLVK
ncbi:hypothetical protein JW935_07310 [candidate division KSB1 bacterium]|nr:hypothetical protein [candidate division KSB1 bacterium]